MVVASLMTHSPPRMVAQLTKGAGSRTPSKDLSKEGINGNVEKAARDHEIREEKLPRIESEAAEKRKKEGPFVRCWREISVARTGRVNHGRHSFGKGETSWREQTTLPPTERKGKGEGNRRPKFPLSPTNALHHSIFLASLVGHAAPGSTRKRSDRRDYCYLLAFLSEWQQVQTASTCCPMRRSAVRR
ncbi:uncharacterized protein [Dermacentor albipictus]|uniref:uncharacterized protein n=1 Tax=Dermacentor albipictus TaxID=60249 RepID=UPI0031FCD268